MPSAGGGIWLQMHADCMAVAPSLPSRRVLSCFEVAFYQQVEQFFATGIPLATTLVLFSFVLAVCRPDVLTVVDVIALAQIMKKPDQGARQRARDLLGQAEDFAAASVSGVVSGLQEDARRPSRIYRDYAHLTLGLEVHFLFPNLNLAERRLLTRLMETRNALALRRQAGPRRGGKRPAGEQPLVECERKLKQLQTRVRTLRRAQALTPVQRAVLLELLADRPRES